MIKANEFRIGNWVLIKEGYCKIRTIDPEDETYGGVVSNDNDSVWDRISVSYSQSIEPIPLTPEILEKCGFAYNFDRGYYFDLKNEFSFNSLSSTGKQIELFDRSGLNCSFQTIQSLHQLQNLYFALTGEELNINLKPSTANH